MPVRGALPGLALAHHADHAVGRPDGERVAGQLARGVGDELDRRTARQVQGDREIAARGPLGLGRDGAGCRRQAALERLADPARGDRLRRVDRPGADGSDAIRAGADLELAVRVRQRTAGRDQGAPSEPVDAVGQADGDPASLVADGDQVRRAEAALLGGHDRGHADPRADRHTPHRGDRGTWRRGRRLARRGTRSRRRAGRGCRGRRRSSASASAWGSGRPGPTRRAAWRGSGSRQSRSRSCRAGRADPSVRPASPR